MSQEFIHNIDAFDSWKSDIGRSLSRFRLWLRRNDLFNEDVDNRLFKLQESLKSQYLTIAFVGEFSRGKTELINSLFFSEYGQRILPSEAGRTTMCPTELFYDRKEARPYLRLLPVETRLESTTLSDYREMPSQWIDVPLMTNSAKEMTLALHTITQTKQVPLKQALALGFEQDMLEKCGDNDDMVEIPAWRHALVSFPHQLLMQGLCILDTPGLNALGSEPELTLKLLPQAQAVIFLLGADTGVTASDMEIWEKHIQPISKDSSVGLFAVLNKIDTLWDGLSSRKKIAAAIKRMVNTTSRQLQIPDSQVIPVSAQKALVAKVRNDKPLLHKSQIDNLEHLLSGSLLENKEQIIWDSVIVEAIKMVNESLQVLLNKSDKLYQQREEFESLTGENKGRIEDLIQANQKDLEIFQRHHLAIQPSQRLLERQTQILLSTISSKILSKEIEITLDELVKSKTTISLFRHMRQFYFAINSIMKELTHEAELTNKMTVSLYQRFTNDFGMTLLEPNLFPAKKLAHQLDDIIKHSKSFDNNLATTLTEHSVAIKRFFSGTVTDVMNFFKSTRQELVDWTQNVVVPLTHQLRMQQELINQHQQELKLLHQSSANTEGKIKGLERLIGEIEMEADNADAIIQSLHSKQPTSKETNVVRISSIGR